MRDALLAIIFAVLGFSSATPGWGATFVVSTGNPDGKMATASRAVNGAAIKIESADNFVLASQSTINSATFHGLLPSGASLGSITGVTVEIYRVFPLDSASPPSGNVPTRVNSPSDVAFASRDSASGGLTFNASILSASFSAANSVVNGIHPKPNQTTGGEGPATGEEVIFTVTFTTPIALPADVYYFVPLVNLSSGNFLWLSAPKPIVPPGTPIVPDIESWIRNSSLAPDWLRVGTDIVGGGPAPTFNGAFSLSGTTGAPPVLQSAASRKVHGSAGTFDQPLSLVAPPGINHNPTTEPRGGPTQTIVMSFDKAILSAGNPTVTEGAATFGTMTISGNDVILNFTGVSNGQFVTFSLANVASVDGGTGGTGSVRVGFLSGDVNQSRQVTVSDVGVVNASILHALSNANFLLDINVDGKITVADKGLANSLLLTKLPAP